MTSPMAAWRVTYTPGEWLVLSGPTMLVVMLPAPPRMSSLVNTLWDDILGNGSVDALLKTFGEYGLDQMSDFAAFFWDEAGLHGMARGQLTVIDADTGDTVVSGSDVVTWREEPLGTSRQLRVGMHPVEEDEFLRLPLVVGAVMASAIHLSTDPQSRVHFPEGNSKGILAGVEIPHQDSSDEAESVTEVVGLGDESEMEPFFESSATPVEVGDEPVHDFDDEIPFWSPPDEDADPVRESHFVTTIPPPAVAPAVVPDSPATGLEAPRQVLAVPCARGHANPPESRTCRICLAPVDAGSPQLINRPALAGVHSNQGDFANVQVAVVVGRAPNASMGPRGTHLLRVLSPSSDISRSHLMVASQDWSIIVTDLDSTNGTTIIPVAGPSFVLDNGESTQVELGTVLDLGDGVSLRIEPPRG